MYNANRTIFLSLHQQSIQINTSVKIIISFSIEDSISSIFMKEVLQKKFNSDVIVFISPSEENSNKNNGSGVIDDTKDDI